MLTTVLVATVLLFTVLVLVGYNQLVRSRNRVREAWSGVDVQLQRRASLIPNLIDAVQTYAQHERATLEQVTRARSALQNAGSAAAAGDANNILTQALGRLFAVVESYPELRANEGFMRLQGELSDVEEKIAYARQFYNRTVLDYNNRIDLFPTVMVARTFDFRPSEFFDAGAEGRAEIRGRFTPVMTGPPPVPPAA